MYIFERIGNTNIDKKYHIQYHHQKHRSINLSIDVQKRGSMSYVAPEIRDKFESLSHDLKEQILKRNVKLNNLQDLIRVLEEIVAEAEQ